MFTNPLIDSEPSYEIASPDTFYNPCIMKPNTFDQYFAAAVSAKPVLCMRAVPASFFEPFSLENSPSIFNTSSPLSNSAFKSLEDSFSGDLDQSSESLFAEGLLSPVQKKHLRLLKNSKTSSVEVVIEEKLVDLEP